MTDLPPPAAPESTNETTPAEPTKPKSALSGGRVILLVILGLVAVGLAWGGTTWLLNSIAPAGDDAPVTNEGDVSDSPDAAEDGFVYTNNDLGYTVTFPAEPEETSSVQQLGGFEIPMTQAQWATNSGLAAVSASTFPDEVMEQGLDTILTNSLAGAAGATGGTLSDEVEAELDGAPARRAVLNLPNGETAEMLVAFQGNVQVSILAGGEVSLDGLIDSFSFTG